MKLTNIVVIPTRAVCLGLAAGLTLGAITTLAHPYATCLTNAAGTVAFRLNETGGGVKVIGNGGTLTNDLGTLSRGLTITNLTASGMTGGLFRVEVTKPGGGVPAIISDNSNTNNQFEFPRGVAVNKRPASPYFGRIYVANARVGTTGTGRPCGDGVYVLNADSSDPLSQTNTALTAGLDMATGGTSMPWRIVLGQNDDNVYLCDWADPDGNLYVAGPNMSAGSGTNVFLALTGTAVIPLDPANNHGSIPIAYVSGSLGSGNLTVWTCDEDYEPDKPSGCNCGVNAMWRYEINAGPLPYTNLDQNRVANNSITFNTGSPLSGQVLGLDRGTNGYFYLLDNRSAGAQNILKVLDGGQNSATELYTSLAESTALGAPNDLLSNAVDVAVSPDQKYLAVLRTGGTIVVLPLVNGIPTLAGRIEFSAIGSSARAVSFDAADNLYVVSNVTERLRIYTLGLTTTAVTTSDPTGSGGAGGAFSLSTPATTVSVTVDTSPLYEATAGTANFTIVRTNDNLANALTVAFTMSGTASRGNDYLLKTNGVTFTTTSILMPAGIGTNIISLVVSNDTTSELQETATLTISGTAFYSAGNPGSASVDIIDNDPAAADVTTVLSSMFEQNTNDYVTFRVTRRGDTNAPSFTVNLPYSGTATSNVDYVAVPSVTIDPGVVSVDFSVNPIDDALLEGDETVTVSVGAGSGYIIGTNSTSATATIVDDELPAATVLYSDNFNTDTSGNYTLRFGSGNDIDDYRTNWVYDYSGDGIPPAPHGADTLGLRLTVNKDDGTLLGGAGVNLYPTGQSFSGNYAVRFDMYLIVNSGSGTTEYAIFGINHSGAKTNWFRGSGNGIGPSGDLDGLWCQVEADGAALGDYAINTTPVNTGGGLLYTPTQVATRTAASLTGIFKSPPWQGSSGAGAPGNVQGTTTPSWAQVEMSQVGNVVTLKINNTTIMSYVNSGTYTSGDIMLGYDDAFDSNTGTGAAVIYDNLKVVALGQPKITSIALAGTNSVMNFTWTLDDPASAFKVQRATVVTGPYADVSGATITRTSSGNYQATAGQLGSAAFYRIRR